MIISTASSVAEHRVPTHQNNLRLIQLSLDPHNGVRLPRVLILGDVRGEFRERDRCWVVPRGLGDLCRKVVQNLGQQRERRPNRILLVRDDYR